MAFGPEDRLLAAGDESGIHIIDVETGQIIQSVPLPGVSDFHWIGDDNLVIGTNDGFWGTIDLDTSELIQSAREALTRSFTDQEWATYRIDPCPTLDEMRSR